RRRLHLQLRVHVLRGLRTGQAPPGLSQLPGRAGAPAETIAKGLAAHSLLSRVVTEMGSGGKANLIQVPLGRADIERYRPLLGDQRWQDVRTGMEELAEGLRGHTLWNVNSTARGGGVAELLASLIPYDRGSGVDERWVVIEGSPEFFDVTKR